MQTQKTAFQEENKLRLETFDMLSDKVEQQLMQAKAVRVQMCCGNWNVDKSAASGQKTCFKNQKTDFVRSITAKKTNLKKTLVSTKNVIFSFL